MPVSLRCEVVAEVAGDALQVRNNLLKSLNNLLTPLNNLLTRVYVDRVAARPVLCPGVVGGDA